MATTHSNGLEVETLTEQEAIDRFNETASLLCLNVPPNTEFGIDLRSWIVGEQFKGLKFIPPGVHYVYWRYASNTHRLVHTLIERSCAAHRIRVVAKHRLEPACFCL